MSEYNWNVYIYGRVWIINWDTNCSSTACGNPYMYIDPELERWG